jgi:hypothetical protein
LERVKALQQNAHEPAHVAWGTRAKRSVPALIALFSFVSHVIVPDHELPTHATFSDHVIKCFEELNECYGGTMNQIHFLSFNTDVRSNKVFTYKEAMIQEDAHLFAEAMQNEVADHELQNYWTIVHCSTVLRTAKLIRLSGHSSISDIQMVHLSSIKLDCGTNYWETFSPVVNMVKYFSFYCLPKYTNLT